MFLQFYGITLTVKKWLHSTGVNVHEKNPQPIRDRTFNNLHGGEGGGGGLWFFVSFRIFFSDNTRVRIFFFPQIITLGYMTKTLNQIIFFFPPPNSEYFFQQHWESEYFFRNIFDPSVLF